MFIMGFRGALVSGWVLIATTFLLLTPSSQGDQPKLQLVTQPDFIYYVSHQTAAQMACEAYGATGISFICNGNPVAPSAQKTYGRFEESRGDNLLRVTLEVGLAEMAMVEGETGQEMWCECRAQDEQSGMVETSRRAIFAQAFLDKEFRQEPASQTVDTGSLAVFACSPPMGEPLPEVTWHKDGERVDPDKNDNLILAPDGTLTILSSRLQDAGTYQCIVENVAGKLESAEVILSVREEEEERASEDVPRSRSKRVPSVPVFTQVPEPNIYVAPNWPVSLVCEVEGADLMTFRCNRQRVDLKKVQTDSDRTKKYIRSVLTLSYAEVENYLNTYREMKYECSCVAWYTDLNSPQRGWQTLLGNSSIITLAELDAEFVEEPRDVTVQEGRPVTFTCQPPAGKPTPKISWVFEQLMVDPINNRRYSVDAQGSLTISRARQSDGGRYSCRAENSMGIRQSRVATLTVAGPGTPLPTTTPQAEDGEYVATFPSFIPDQPVITRDLDKVYYLNEEGKATLVCTVVSADQITYRCNNNRLPDSKQNVQEQTDRDSGKKLLTVTTVITDQDLASARLDNFTCQCRAWYIDGGWQSKGGTAAVIWPSYIDSVFTYEPRGGVYRVGEPAKLACQPPGGNPTPTLTWIKDGREIDPSLDNNFIIMQDGSLQLSKVRVQDAGRYVCQASNIAGVRASSPALLELFTITDPEPTAEPESTGDFWEDLETTTDYYPVDYDVLPSGKIRPFFAFFPEPVSYVVGDSPAHMSCEVVEAPRLLFVCNGQILNETLSGSGFKMQDPESGFTILSRQLAVTREQLENGPDPYTCLCRAYYKEVEDGDWVFESTNATTFTIASIDNDFLAQPTPQFVEEGSTSELVCLPPKGNPHPTVYWEKDGLRLSESNKRVVTTEGSLVLTDVSSDDSGSYTCVAENLIAKRYSNTVALQVLVIGDGNEKRVTPSGGAAEGEGEPTEGEAEGEGEPEGEAEGEGEPEGEAEEGKGEPEREAEMGKGELGGQADLNAEGLFVKQPEAMSYVTKWEEVTISCHVRGPVNAIVSCNGQSLPYSDVEYEYKEEEDVLKASIRVSRMDVEYHIKYQGEEDYFCQCMVKGPADADGKISYITSSKAYVQLAYLKKKFRREPKTQTVQEGMFTSLNCEPPEGKPLPEVYWMFNGEKIDHVKLPDNALLLGEVGAQHAGSYVCVANSLVGTRRSKPAILTVDVGGALVTGQTDRGELDMEPSTQSSVDYDVTITPEPSPDQQCLRLISECDQFRPKFLHENNPSCQNADKYVSCMKEFVETCRGVVLEETLTAAEDTYMTVEHKCNWRSPDGGMCLELQECEAEYLEGTQHNLTEANTMPMTALCPDIQSLLRCAASAAKPCQHPKAEIVTELVELAVWWDSFCDHVLENESAGWAKQCQALSECDLPLEQTTVLYNMVQPALWCPYMVDLVGCTENALSTCGLDAQDDLNMLSSLINQTCLMPSPEDDEEMMEGEVGDGEMITPEAETGDTESEGKSASMDDGRDSLGQSVGGDGDGDGGDSGVGNVKASLLLMSVLSVVILLMTWR